LSSSLANEDTKLSEGSDDSGEDINELAIGRGWESSSHVHLMRRMWMGCNDTKEEIE